MQSRRWLVWTLLASMGAAAACSDSGSRPALDFVGADAAPSPDLGVAPASTCSTDLDCAPGVAPGCGSARCGDGGVCVVELAADGSACDDHNACTEGEACAGGGCAGGTNVCACEVDSDCAAFDDGDACNGSLVCVAGGCVPGPGGPVVCAAAPCHTAACDPATGQCTDAVAPDGSACDDGDACTAGEACVGGLCEGGVALTCAAPAPCSAVVCDPAVGCVEQPLADGTPCVDADPCTSGERCAAGSCQGGAGHCACVSDEDCAAFDVDRCDGGLRCEGGLCVADGAPPVVCTPTADPCRESVCDPSTGACAEVPATDGAPCGEPGTCLEGGSCAAGSCVAAEAACDDANPCTVDACDALAGCVHAPATGACDDGDGCTAGDTCQGGACVGTAIPCACSEASDCSGPDFDPCKGEWECAAGKCAVRPGTAVVCPAAGPCASSACDPATGACVVGEAPDGVPCDDGKVCTVGERCQAGVCGGGAPVACDDGNPCTNDACVPGEGCVSTPNAAPCDDGNACTKADACSAGKCKGGAAVSCPGAGPCRVGTCQASTGCAVQPAPDATSCDDGNACTAGDACQAGECVGEGACPCRSDGDCVDDGDLCNGTPRCLGGSCAVDPATVVSCAAGSDCVTVSCAPATGTCVSAPVADGTACFGGGCTGPGSCAGGSCVAPPLDCGDGNPCTVDACLESSGQCAHTPANGTVCNDGEPCTQGDHCTLGACVGGAPRVCDDGDACTADTCVAGEGCVFAPQVSCDDGDACTVDGCSPATGCVHEAKVCAAALLGPCEAATCDPATGACSIVALADGSACDDGDPCTEADACADGQCLGEALACDDGEACTADGCEGGACVHVPAAGPCDDGDPCTTADVCSAAGCAGQPLACDDGDECTADTCVAGSCVHDKIPLCGVGVPCDSPAGSSCDDGDATTTGDICLGGVCLGFTRTLVPGPIGTAVALRHVDYAAGRWFVGIESELATIPGGALGEVTGTGSVSTATETAGLARFKTLRGGFATDSSGRLWRFEPASGGGSWSSGGPASKAFASLGAAAASALWTSADVGSGLGIVLWTAGSSESPAIRRCTGAQGDSVTCVNESTAATKGTLMRAFAGTPCAGTACQSPDLSLAGDFPAGSSGGNPQYYNDIFGREQNAATLWPFAFMSQSKSTGDARDATALADGRHLVVGARGYLRARSASGSWGGSFEVKSSDSRTFEGAWSGAGVVALAAWRTGGNSSRVFELWLARTTGELDSSGSWNVVQLASESGGGNAIYDVWGTAAGSIRVVGTRSAGFGAADGVVYSRMVE
ncbi:MAG: hypothetical protein H6746_08125 [Deltaproteobacteria bacterium]|nr:hypothetical protein [Deltaproteobacteria bacterium]